jgi:ABC-2 type transport system ATP-binding protein
VNERRIEFKKVDFTYLPGVPVWSAVDLMIGSGLTLILGANGSGKSTLLKLAVGVEKPDFGSVLVNGFDLWRHEVNARRDLAYVPEQPDVTPYASVEEILRLVCWLRGVEVTDAGEVLLEVGLEDLRKRSLRQLSKGQRRRALLAAALIGGPKTLVLDEPLDTMDRGIRVKISEWLEKVCRSGGLALVATHEIEPFAGLASRAIAVAKGRVQVFEPLPASLQDRLTLLERLGRSDF